MNNKKRNNKGFSLVELIVVVAIMAVLVGVLAPAYLKYVEESRVQKDVSAIGEVVNAIEIAMADEDVNTNTETASYSFTGGTEYVFPTGDTATDLDKELAETIEKIELTAKGFKGKEVKIEVTNADGDLTIEVTTTATSEVALEALEKVDEYKATAGGDTTGGDTTGGQS